MLDAYPMEVLNLKRFQFQTTGHQIDWISTRYCFPSLILEVLWRPIDKRNSANKFRRTVEFIGLKHTLNV
jgi:hypothetical protein